MAKIYSPTANLYALLAVEDEHNQTRTAKAAAKNKEQEMTPKERAEAKAVQEAERRAKKEAAEKAKREAEERKKAIEALNIDDTGFTTQRHQRIKESKETRTGNAQTAEVQKPKGQNRQGKPGSGKPEKFGNKFDNKSFDKSVEKGPRQEGKGKEGKSFNKGQGQDNRPPRGREFDKHSQGVVSRKPGAKKGGAGKGNWDNAAKSVPTGTTAEEAASSPAVAATAEPDAWDNVQDATPTDAEAKPAEGEAAEGAEKKSDDESADNKMTLEEYQAIQAKKKEELAAKLGGITAPQPRALSEEETRALAKFTLVENTKAQKPASKPAAAKDASSPAARKPAKQPVMLEINVAHPPRAGTRGGKGRFNGNRGERDQNREKKGRVAKPAKLPRGGNFDAQFPSLG